MRAAEYEAKMPVSEFVERFVDVDKFIKRCEECPMYGRKWSCPPFDFDVNRFWRQYGTIRLVARKIKVELRDGQDGEDFFYEARRNLLYKLVAMESVHPGSMTLAAGSCDYCGRDNCSRALGQRCRFPEKCHYSLEALGGDVELAAREIFGLEMEWGSEGSYPDHFIMMGALLTKE